MKNNYIKLFGNPSTVVEVREIQMQTPMHIRQTAIVTTMSPSPQAGSAKKKTNTFICSCGYKNTSNLCFYLFRLWTFSGNFLYAEFLGKTDREMV